VMGEKRVLEGAGGNLNGSRMSRGGWRGAQGEVRGGVW